jgi:hypothetical protein
MRVAANRARWREIAAVDFSGLMMMMMMMMMVMTWKHGRTPWLSLHSNPLYFQKGLAPGSRGYKNNWPNHYNNIHTHALSPNG